MCLDKGYGDIDFDAKLKNCTQGDNYEKIKSKEKFSGCTVHFVNSKLDSGKIILQKKVKVFKNDN